MAAEKPSLVLLTPDGTRRAVPLSDQPVTVGRADTCDIVLREDAEVSREHADIWIEDGDLVVVADRGSKNGTRVDNGELFRRDRRYAYRNIRIGEHVFEIVDGMTPPPDGERSVSFTEDDEAVGDTQFFPSTRGFDLSAQRLGLLVSLTERIGGVFERKQLLQEALDACCEALGFERGLIALKTARGDTELPVTRNIERAPDGAFRVSRSLINRALVDGERAIVNNPATDLGGAISDSMMRFPICSALCVPILHRGEVLGVIYGDRVTQASTYETGDVDFLGAIAQQVGVGLSNLRLFQEHVRSQRVYAELQQARRIQQGLLPPAALKTGGIVFEGYNQPSSAISGDYFDFFPIDEQRVGVIIADVTGHGLPAALVMANVQSAIRVALDGDMPLVKLAARINRLVYENTSSSVFVTGMLGVVDTGRTTFDFISAGHPGPLLRGGDEWARFEPANSLPFGIYEQDRYEVNHISLHDDARTLLFFTDGLIEALDDAGEMLGADPVLRELRLLENVTPATVIEAARNVVQRHLGEELINDDMTFVVIHRP